MTTKIRMLKLVNQDILMTTIVGEDDKFVYLDNPSLVYAENDPQTKTTKISYIPWMPFYSSQEGIAIRKEHIIVGLFEEVNKELQDRYNKMINPSKLITPNSPKLIV